MLSITMLEIEHQKVMLLATDREARYQGIMLPVLVREPIRRGLLPRTSHLRSSQGETASEDSEEVIHR